MKRTRMPEIEFDAEAKAKFWRKVSPAPSDACWLWRGALGQSGYGNAYWRSMTYLAHRIAYTLQYGPIPSGLELDHLCRTPQCVNPAHLEPVTPLVNMRRMTTEGPDERPGFCIRGHELTPSNTRVSGTRKYCRTCWAEASRRYRMRKRREDMAS